MMNPDLLLISPPAVFCFYCKGHEVIDDNVENDY